MNLSKQTKALLVMCVVRMAVPTHMQSRILGVYVVIFMIVVYLHLCGTCYASRQHDSPRHVVRKRESTTNTYHSVDVIPVDRSSLG